MKKLLGLLGTILITGNALPTVIAAAPNRKQRTKTKLLNSELNYSQTNNLENLQRSKRQNNEDISNTPKIQDEQQSQFSSNSDNQIDIIEKEVTLDKNYSEGIKKILQELIDEKYIDPLRSINMGGLISKELDNKTIISKLEELDPKMINWIKKQQNNKEKILILTLKNSNNKRIKLVINLNNLYLLGFINNQNQYFYFDDELLEKIKQHNQEEIKKLNNLKEKLNNLKENKLLFNEEKVKEYLQQKNELIPLKEKEKKIKKLNYNNELNSLNKKINNLQGENLKDEEKKIKALNESVIKKYNCQNINLNYTGAYTSDGLNVVIKENGKLDKGKDIIISKDTLNNAITNLTNYHNKQQNQSIKDDLVRMIFITSEAMRFQCDEKTLEIFAEIKNTNELKKIIAESQNILINIQEKIFIKNQKINWKDYTSQLRGDWKKYSEQFNKFRIEIWNELNEFKKIFNFINDSKYEVNEFLTKILDNNVEKIKQILKIAQETNLIQKINKYDLDNKQAIIFLLSIKKDIITWKKRLDKLFPLKNWKEIEFGCFKFLHVTILQRNLDLTKLLINIDAGTTDINPQYKNSLSLLYYAIDTGDIQIVKLLIDNGADVNFQDENGLTPLHFAIENAIDTGDIQIVKLLIDNGADPNVLDCNNDFISPLHYAIIKNKKEVVEVLLKSKNIKNKINNKSYLNIGCLHWISLNSKNINNLEIAELLIDNGADVNLQDENDATPLYYAISTNNKEMVQLLINKGANIKNITKNGLTPLYYAIILDNKEMVQLLIEKGANVNMQDENGLTPLHFAIEENNQEMVQLLINNNADVNIKITSDGATILHYAILNNKKEMVKLLIKKGANVNKGVNGLIPLYYAISTNNKEMVQLLINKGANVNMQDENDFSPLYYAINEENIEIVKLLLANDADVNLQNKNGLTPLLYSKYNKYIKIENLFKNFINLKNKIESLNEQLKKIKINEQKTKINNNLKKSEDKLKKLLYVTLDKKIYTPIYTQKTITEYEYNAGIGQNNLNAPTHQNNLYDVPADNSCLFWSVATAYLLPVRNNYEEFRARFIQLFGEENLKNILHLQKLLQQYDLINNRNLNQLWYKDVIVNNLVTNVFRNSVEDYIEKNLDNPIQNNSNRSQAPTFRNLIQENNEVASNYLERMRQSSSWGGVPEIIAMSNILNSNISVNNDGSYQPVHQNANNNNIAISYVELEKGSGINNHYNFALTPEEDQTNHPIVINDNQGNAPVVDITKRPDNLLPITPKPEANAIKLAVDDHGQYHANLANNNNDDDANQGNNIAKAPEPATTPLQKDEYHFVDKKTEDDSLKNDENLEINLIKNNKDEIKQNASAGNQSISTNIENLQTTTAEAINQYNALSKEEKLKKLNEINRYYQTLPENDKKTFKEKLTNTGLAALSGGALTAYGTKITVSGTAAATGVTNAEAMEMAPLLSTSTTESLAAAETITVAETAAVEGGVIAGEAGTAAALAPETLGLSLVIGGLAIAGTWMYLTFHHHATSDIALPTSIHHNVYDNIEKWYKFLAHDQLKIKINKNTWNEIKQNKNSQATITKIIKNKFIINDHSGWGESVTNEDFNTLVKVILLHFEQINGYFEILDNENDGFVIITNTEGDWLGIE
ncbi:ankyrin repeat domain-containing protein [Spiroplasma endosymbiont of Dilophus febrilis]|uniref:ankyrin repeat domain-containing protein n=1 Tax=Spiroplasma endosymbiont of Dilophus febrilis TaxID=3066292 RepID=UPI00313B272E